MSRSAVRIRSSASVEINFTVSRLNLPALSRLCRHFLPRKGRQMHKLKSSFADSATSLLVVDLDKLSVNESVLDPSRSGTPENPSERERPTRGLLTTTICIAPF